MSLRFAPIVRVSTERQADKGESLRTQKDQIINTVNAIEGGTIPEQCWQYSGQEHATPDHERKLLDKLLEDSGKDLFDAVIVMDPSRWSRDNLKSEEGLRALKANGIRFFVGSSEYELDDPGKYGFLALNAVFHQMNAEILNQKSIINRINRAKEGIPCAGKLPYGRTWSEAKGWDTDEEKKAIIEQAATRYLAGESMITIGQSYGMNPAGLYRTMREKSGTKWVIRFRKPDLKIDETVDFTIPRLLSDKTIQAIAERAAANKTYTHGELKNRYLLSRMIFCQKCGRTLFGSTNKDGNGYYVHSRSKALTMCTEHKHIPVKIIEPAVLLLIARSLGDVDLIKKAISDATPDQEKAKGLRSERGITEEAPEGSGPAA